MRWTVSLVASAGVVGLWSAAWAAPQALLVVAAADVELLCEGESCDAEVTTICLQPDRAAPRAGHPYRVAAETDGRTPVWLVGRTKSGAEIAVPAHGLEIAAKPSHVEVTASVPRAVVEGLGFERVALRFEGRPVLAPLPTRRDPEAVPEGELQRIQAALRPAAETTLATLGPRVEATQLIREAANRLTRRRYVPSNEAEPILRQTLAAAGAATAGLTPAGRALAEGAVMACTGPQINYQPIRDCLNRAGNDLMEDVNRAYWRALDFGS